MPFAAALSEHPLATHAVGEVVGQVLEALGPAPDLAVLVAGAAHTGAMEDIAASVDELLGPRVLVGCTAATVVGGTREVEQGGGLSLWAARGLTAHAQHLRAGASPAVPPGTVAMLVIADPFTHPVDDLLHTLDVPVVGGLASAGRGPGGNRLVIGRRVLVDGAVAVSFAGLDVETVVSQGCRPIGAPLIVTRGEGNLVLELGGRPALERVQDVIRTLTPEEVELARAGLHVGRVVDESKSEFGRGDFIVRSVLGADPSVGAVAVGDEIEVGATIQFQVRDAASADDDLRQLMASRRADGALVFTCSGRGTHLFGVQDHDATVIADALPGAAIAGMSCAGEIGPVGGRSFLHGLTAAVLLFRDRRSPGAGDPRG